MLFNSISFAVFFPVITLLYYIIPEKVKNYWLLVGSFYFYACWNTKFLFLLIICILISYFGGMIIDHFGKNMLIRKFAVFLCLAILLGILCFYKYTGFILNSIGKIFNLMRFPVDFSITDILLPVGISFYIFQMIAYLFDVYHKKLSCEKNIFHFALFISFFPKLASGPIVNSKHFLRQLKNPHVFNEVKVQSGLLMMLWGFFEKIVISGTASQVVGSVWENFGSINSVYLLTSAVIFSIYIYSDFSGYSHIAIGAAQVMGFELPDNFRQPYFATSVKDFWHRWHISLSWWLREYIYIPLGGSKRGTIRKYFNKFAVFVISGLWHGAGWHYVFWGALHGFYQIVEDLVHKIGLKINLKFFVCIRKKFSVLLDMALRLKTAILVSIAWIFFWSPSLREGVRYVLCMFSQWQLEKGDFLTQMGLTRVQWVYLLLAIIVLAVVDIFRENNKPLGIWLAQTKPVIRWGICLSACVFIILVAFGNFGQDAVSFIYFQF